MISFIDEDIKSRLTEKRVLKKWISDVVSSYGYKLGNVCYIFCSDAYILDVNKKYLNHDYFTDIITFDYVENGIISGDMFISIETVTSNTLLYKSSFSDELHRVIIHGILHLCGLKDKTPADEKMMRDAENKALSMLSVLLLNK